MPARIIIIFIILISNSTVLFSQSVQHSYYYDYMWGFYDGYSPVEQNGKIGAINLKMKLVVPCIYDQLNAFDLSPAFLYGAAPFRKKDKWGAIDTTGKVIIPFEYDKISTFFNYGICIVKKGKKFGCINCNGQVVLPLIYDDISYLRNGLRCFRLNDRVGYMDSLNSPVIPFKYDDGYNFSENLAAVKMNGKWGFINNKDSVVIPFMYDSVADFSEGLAAVSLNYKCGFINAHNQTIIPFIYAFGNYKFNYGFATIEKGGKIGYINKKDDIIIPFDLSEGSFDYCGGYFIVRKDNYNKKTGNAQLYALFDSTGKQITDFLYSEMYYAGKNRFSVKQNSLVGIIDETGKVIVPIKYGYILPGYHGICTASLNNKLGYIDSAGNTLIPFIYDNASEFSAIFGDTIATVFYHGISRVINTKGQFIDNLNPNQQIKIYYDNNTLSVSGEIKDFSKVGEWNYYYYNRRKKETFHFKNGIKIGRDEVWDSSGVPTEIDYYKNNKLNGKSTTYDSTGYIDYYNIYRNGVFIRHIDVSNKNSYVHLIFFPNGRIKEYGPVNKYDNPIGKWLNGIMVDSNYYYEIGKYNNASKNGKWKHYNADGKLLFTETYKNGELQYPEGHVTIYDMTGQPRETGKIVNGQKDSVWTSYFDGKKIFTIENYFMGEPLGEYNEYNDTGNLITSGNYALIELINDSTYKIILKKEDYTDNIKKFTGLEYEEWNYYYSDGKIEEKGSYSFKTISSQQSDSLNNLIHNGDTAVYYQNWQPMQIKSGLWTDYYDNGQIKSTGYYYPIEFKVTTVTKNISEQYGATLTEVLTGISPIYLKDKNWKYYSEDGKLIRDEVYENTKLVSVKTY